MKLEKLIGQIKQHPRYKNAGMVLYHNGVVRETSRDGRRVTGLTVTVVHDKLAQIIAEQKQRPGIIEILVNIDEGRKLNVGDDVMFIAVAGDIRDNVLPVLGDTLNAIKKFATSKTEFFE